ncbi:hypothetical protein KFE94_04065 [bacterium SCSIO 12643]|nr:hypothetical protein KFE94_04065 [bacterium SCSIO 12643]
MFDKILLIILITLFPILGFSQITFDDSDYNLDTNKITIGIRSEAYNNSNALNSMVLNTALFGGYISREDRAHMASKLRATNNTGSYLNNSIFYSQRIDSLFGSEVSKLSFHVNLADKQENLSVFSENAALLSFYGNKQYAGESVRLTPFDFNQIHYSKFQLGISKEFKSGNKFNVGIAFLYGQNNRRSEVERLNLIVSENGDLIGTDAELSIFETDRGNTGFFNYNGAGTSIDMSGVFNLHLLSDSTHPAKFHVSIQDFGFIQWHATSSEISADTFYTYDGIHFQNIFDPNAINTGGNPIEIIDSISTTTLKSFTTFVPATIRFYLQQDFNQWTFAIGGMQRINAFYYPFFYGKAGYHFNSSWLLSGQLNYGGYGGLGGGLEIQYITPKYNFKLGSTNIEGFIAPTKIAGQSIYFLLSYKISS